MRTIVLSTLNQLLWPLLVLPLPPRKRLRGAVFETITRPHSMHGSEELETSPPLTNIGAGHGVEIHTNATQPRSGATAELLSVNNGANTGHYRSSSPARAEQGTRNETEYATWPITSWEHEHVVNFLEAKSISPEGMRLIMEDHWDGNTLLTVVGDDEVHEVLRDELGIGSRAKRLAIISIVKALDTRPAQAAGDYNTHSSKRYLLPGERALEIPTIPKADPGHSLPNPTMWKEFLTAAQGWAELSAPDYAFLISLIQANPLADADQLFTKLRADEMRVDLVLGTHLYNKASADMRRVFVLKQDYMVQQAGDSKLSGLKIISYLGQKILRQCTSSWLTLNNKLTKREPVYKISDLYKEINEILAIKEELFNQGQPVSEATYFSVLHNAVSELITVPRLIVPLAMPIKDCEKMHGYSGSHLLAYLRDI